MLRLRNRIVKTLGYGENAFARRVGKGILTNRFNADTRQAVPPYFSLAFAEVLAAFPPSPAATDPPSRREPKSLRLGNFFLTPQLFMVPFHPTRQRGRNKAGQKGLKALYMRSSRAQRGFLSRILSVQREDRTDANEHFAS